MQQASTYHRVIALAAATFAAAALVIAVTPGAASASTTAVPQAGLEVTGAGVDGLTGAALPNGTALRQDPVTQLLAQLTGGFGGLDLAEGLKLPLGLG